ncbi:MAG: hypothetical protein IT204_21745 [Fimbriimonadaceae bacterium]|nr:hypothetical protein [Fimbriimonadaceae bacterium]
MALLTPICQICQHYRDGTGTCGAFPAGIPSEILEYRADHRLPFAGDQGLRYERAADVDDSEYRRYADMLDRFVKPAAPS